MCDMFSRKRHKNVNDYVLNSFHEEEVKEGGRVAHGEPTGG